MHVTNGENNCENWKDKQSKKRDFVLFLSCSTDTTEAVPGK
jgi:hypothetical protein